MLRIHTSIKTRTKDSLVLIFFFVIRHKKEIQPLLTTMTFILWKRTLGYQNCLLTGEIDQFGQSLKVIALQY